MDICLVHCRRTCFYLIGSFWSVGTDEGSPVFIAGSRCDRDRPEGQPTGPSRLVAVTVARFLPRKILKQIPNRRTLTSLFGKVAYLTSELIFKKKEAFSASYSLPSFEPQRPL